MKQENLVKLAEIIISEELEEYNGTKYIDSSDIRMDNYYKLIDFDEALELDRLLEQKAVEYTGDKDYSLWDDEWYVPASDQWLEIWAKQFVEAYKSGEIYSYSWCNGKETKVTEFEHMIETFVKPNKKEIESIVAMSLVYSEKYDNLFNIFRDYINCKKVAKDVWDMNGGFDGRSFETFYKHLLETEEIY